MIQLERFWNLARRRAIHWYTTKQKVNLQPFVYNIEGKVFDQFAKKARSVCNIATILTTKNFKKCLLSSESKFASKLRNQVVYQLTSSRCKARYVGQIFRYSTRLEKHNKDSSPVGMHLTECGLDSNVNS